MGAPQRQKAVRRAIQHSQESLRALGKRYGVDQKTVAKRRGRTSTADLPTGPRVPRSTVLSVEEEAVIVAFRRYTLLPLAGDPPSKSTPPPGCRFNTSGPIAVDICRRDDPTLVPHGGVACYHLADGEHRAVV